MKNILLVALLVLVLLPSGLFAPTSSPGGGTTKASASAQSLTEGQSSGLFTDLLGNLWVALGVCISGESICNDGTYMIAESHFGYETVAASQTDQVMGSTGAIGNVFHTLVCTYSADPSTGVSIKDGSGSAILVIPDTGAAGVLNSGAMDILSVSGAWKVTTGTNTTCIATGRFT